MTVDELKQVHAEQCAIIRSRLEEFGELASSASDESIFEELSFCIYTAGASARMGLRSVERVRPALMNGSLKEVRNALSGVHRWPVVRSAHVVETREYLRRHCGLRMRRLLASFSDPEELRDFFAANPGVRGLGYKEASHFLRNIGYRGYAILDKHILSRLHGFDVIDSPRPHSGRTAYLVTESKMKLFSDSVGIDFDEMDLLLWYTKTGEILK